MKKVISALLLLAFALGGTLHAGERWDEQFNDPHTKGWIDTNERGVVKGGYTLGLFGDSMRSLGLKQTTHDLNGQLRFEKQVHFSDWDLDSIRGLIEFDLYGPVDQGFWWIRPSLGLSIEWQEGFHQEITTTTTTTEREVVVKKIKIRRWWNHPVWKKWWHPWCKHKHHKHHKHWKWCKPLIITKKYIKETTTTTTETRMLHDDDDLIFSGWVSLQAGIARTLGSVGHGAFWIEGGHFFRGQQWYFSLNWIFAPQKWIELDMQQEWNWYPSDGPGDIFVADFGLTLTGEITKTVSVFGRVSGWVSDQNSRDAEFRGGVQVHFQ